MSHQRGQAAADYIAVLALVAVVLAAGTAVAAAHGAPGIVNAVVGQARHALCLVGGQSCPILRSRPCVVTSTRDTRHAAATVALLRVDEGHVLLRERLSDGRVRLELAEHDGVGIEAGVGARVDARLGPLAIGLGSEMRAALLGVLGHGRVFIARDERAADAVVDELTGPSLAGPLDGPYRAARALLGKESGPRPDQVFVEGGGDLLAEAGLSGRGITAAMEGGARAALGGLQDRRTGELTVYLRAGGAGQALANALLGSGGGAVRSDAMLALTLDRHRRPVELALLASGVLHAGGSMPAGLTGVLASVGSRAAVPGSGRRWELDARVDLADPRVAASWAAFVRAPARADAVQALAERLRDGARLDLRTYRTTSSLRGVRASVGLGVKLGGEIEHALDRAELVAAASRPPGGVWERRGDCVRGP